MKRAYAGDVIDETNKRARMANDSNESICNDHPTHEFNTSVNQSSQLSKLVFYPFLLPLVIKFLHIDSVINLILVCKDIRPYVINFPIEHKDLTQDEANKLIDPTRYVTFRVIQIHDATSPDLSMHPLLEVAQFDPAFNIPVEPGHLPPKLFILSLGNKFNQYTKPGTIPSNVERMLLPSAWNQPVKSGVFSQIEALVFGHAFNHLLEPGCFSSKLVSLTFGAHFDQPLLAGVLPSSLRNLQMSISFNQPLLPGVLPVGLQSLNLGSRFQHPLGRGVLPDTLETLKLSMFYNHPLEPGELPSSLTSLQFGELFSQPITVGIIPSSVISLSFSCGYQCMIPPGSIPSSAKRLVMGCNQLELCLEPGSIPNTIQSLELGYYFALLVDAELFNESAELDIPPDVAPTHIKTLILNQVPRPGTIPDHITRIEFGNDFNRPIPVDVIPDTVKTLIFGVEFDQPIAVGSIPCSIERLQFGSCFNQPLSSGMIPNSVTRCSFLFSYDQPIKQDSLPDSVQFLSFGSSFSASSLLVIPRGVTHLTLGRVTSDELVERLLPLVLESKVTHLSVRLMSDTRCFFRCDDAFILHSVDGYLSLKDSSCWPPASEHKTKEIGKILFSEIEIKSLTADRFI